MVDRSLIARLHSKQGKCLRWQADVVITGNQIVAGFSCLSFLDPHLEINAIKVGQSLLLLLIQPSLCHLSKHPWPLKVLEVAYLLVQDLLAL